MSKTPMLKIQMFIHNLMNPLANKEGATAVEYGLMVALIAAVIIVGVTALGVNVEAKFVTVAAAIAGA